MQAQKQPKSRRKYDAEFKTEVLKMLANGQTAAYIANALGISENIIYRWKNTNQVGKKALVQQGDLARKNQQLKDRVRQLESCKSVTEHNNYISDRSINEYFPSVYFKNSFNYYISCLC